MKAKTLKFKAKSLKNKIAKDTKKEMVNTYKKLKGFGDKDLKDFANKRLKELKGVKLSDIVKSTIKNEGLQQMAIASAVKIKKMTYDRINLSGGEVSLIENLSKYSGYQANKVERFLKWASLNKVNTGKILVEGLGYKKNISTIDTLLKNWDKLSKKSRTGFNKVIEEIEKGNGYKEGQRKFKYSGRKLDKYEYDPKKDKMVKKYKHVIEGERIEDAFEKNNTDTGRTGANHTIIDCGIWRFELSTEIIEGYEADIYGNSFIYNDFQFVKRNPFWGYRNRYKNVKTFKASVKRKILNFEKEYKQYILNKKNIYFNPYISKYGKGSQVKKEQFDRIKKEVNKVISVWAKEVIKHLKENRTRIITEDF